MRPVRGILVLLTLLGGWSAILPLAAHPLIQNPLWLTVSPTSLNVRVFTTVKEVAVTQGIRAQTNEIIDTAILELAFSMHQAHVLTNLSVRSEGGTINGRVESVTMPDWSKVESYNDAEQLHGTYDLEYSFPAGTRSLTLIANMLRGFSYAPGVRWEVSYQARIQRSGQSGVDLMLMRPGEPIVLATSAMAGAGATRSILSGAGSPSGHRTLFGEYLRQGVRHILTGYDHLLFVSALILAAASFWNLFKVIGAFTLAHTVTLTLASLNLVRLPDRWVEPLIAISIIFVAVENIWFPRRAAGGARLIAAFGFGLVHGLGFAGGLREAMADLPGLAFGLALVGFSLGVELGHQIVVLPCWTLLHAIRTDATERILNRCLRLASGLVAGGGVWFLYYAIKTTWGFGALGAG